MTRIAVETMPEKTTSEPDALVDIFMRSEDPAASERALSELLSAHAEPRVRRLIRQKLAYAGFAEQQDIEDLCAEVLAELLYQLRRAKADRTRKSIENFSSYTSVTAYRAYSDYLRNKYPQRHRLKTQIRYLLQADSRFAIWESPPHVWLCGLSRWDSAQKDLRKNPTEEEIRELSDESAGAKRTRPGDFVARLLSRLAAPIELDDLVGIVGDLWGIGRHANVPLDETDAGHIKRVVTSDSCLELKEWLARLWVEVGGLPLHQRYALLLNLRDEYGGSALALVTQTGIASIREIALVLEMEPMELAAMWNRLPIDDLTIAGHLGLTRQQIINLRKSARARLTRRCGGGAENLGVSEKL